MCCAGTVLSACRAAVTGRGVEQPGRHPALDRGATKGLPRGGVGVPQRLVSVNLPLLYRSQPALVFLANVFAALSVPC